MNQHTVMHIDDCYAIVELRGMDAFIYDFSNNVCSTGGLNHDGSKFMSRSNDTHNMVIRKYSEYHEMTICNAENK